jgi:hypothetical protein
VPVYKTASVCQFFTQKNVTPLYHPLYSPDLSLPEYLLFPKLKIKLKDSTLQMLQKSKKPLTDELKKVQKEEFLAAFQKLYDLAKAFIYIYANGAYFK